MEVILIRDQRTTSHRVLDNAASNRKSSSSSSSSSMVSLSRQQLEHRTKPSHCYRVRVTDERNNRSSHLPSDSYVLPQFYDDRDSGWTRRGPSSYDTWLRFCILVYIATLVRSAPAMTASPPKWHNPCGDVHEFKEDPLLTNYSDENTETPLQNDALLSQVLTQADQALVYANGFRDDYARETFQIDFADLHSTWKVQKYGWLPGLKEIPKHLGERLKLEYLDKLELDKTLVDTYEYMQKYAVGLEQITKDQDNCSFQENFKHCEYVLRSVLCEMSYVMSERGVTPRPDVSRDIMPIEYRRVNSTTQRDLRDWLIFRDYMNALEYVIEVFKYLSNRKES